MISYLDAPLYISREGNIEILESTATAPDRNWKFFLLLTGKQRKTEPLVNWYKTQLENESFSRMVHEELIPVNARLISAWLGGNTSECFKQFKVLSSLQLMHLDHMIIEPLKPLWQRGIESNAFYLKLCGAGGGGCYLGICKREELPELLSKAPFPIQQLDL